jgi:Zn-dependent peptidase ImmA (M78 family)
MKLPREDLGIPVLDAEDVEQLSGRFLSRVAPACLRGPRFAPLAEIMQAIQSKGLCTFSFDEDLGCTPEGYKYLGYFDIKRKHIAIDVSLSTEDPRFPFTVAHELGHFYMHGKIKPEALRSVRPDEIRDSTRDLVTHRIDAANPRSLLEWQANRFAAGILMPRLTVRDGLVEVQRARGIRRQLGLIWVDRQPSSNREYGATLTQLAAMYRVSRSVARYRLRELGLLHFDANTMPRRISESLGDALGELFGD